MASGGIFPSILNLNVGGIVYTTNLKTITRDSNSKLEEMFSCSEEIAQDSNGNYFIDRDGSLFRHVLNFLRTRKLCLPQSFDELEQLSAEADFYQVDDLTKAIQRLREDRRRNPPPSDELGVIVIIEFVASLFVSGRDTLIEDVFEEWDTTPDTCTGSGLIAGYKRCRQITAMSKADAFDLLYKKGFQLEGCDRGASYGTEYHEYIFGRKN